MNSTRRRLLIGTLPLGLLTACGKTSNSPKLALVGGTLFDGTGEEPLANSVIIIDDGRFRTVGSRSSTPVPLSSQQVDLTGKYIVPDLVDVMPDKWVEPHYTEREVDDAVRAGEPIVFGVPADREIVPVDLMDLIRSSNVALAPLLSRLRDTARLEFAKANVKTMLESGLTVAIASGDHTRAGMAREMNLMTGGGADPKDILVAATRNGAKALKEQNLRGTIEEGKSADLLILPGNPLQDLGMINRVEKTMRGGAWKEST